MANGFDALERLPFKAVWQGKDGTDSFFHESLQDALESLFAASPDWTFVESITLYRNGHVLTRITASQTF